MRLVLDTNVIISATLWGGLPRKVVESSIAQHSICFSLAMLQEIERVFEYPKFKNRLSHLSFSLDEFLARLTENAIVIANPLEENIIINDPADNKFLACALACSARFIVSGDDHLLHLKEYKHIRIVKPSECLKALDLIH